MCAAAGSLMVPWMSRDLIATVDQVEQLQPASAPFVAMPSQPSVRVFAGMNAR